MQQFAQGKRMGFRGHTLVWHSQVAPWVTAGNYRPTQLAEIIKRHISTVARRYSGKIYAWDVVNEAFNDNGTLRPSVWYNQPGIGFATQGTKYIEQAFVWTRNADPTARLYYNDYSIETIGPKSNAVYNMVRDFRQRNVPIHGVGFQAHLDLNFNNASTLNSFRQNLRRFKALGVELQITELDIRLPSNSAEHLQQQANLADKLVDICLSEGVSLIQFWGFTDRYSWVPGFFTGYGWALPFDENYLPKPFYEAVRNRLILGPSPT
jgi:endo-1,4-beta-xylanase